MHNFFIFALYFSTSSSFFFVQSENENPVDFSSCSNNQMNQQNCQQFVRNSQQPQNLNIINEDEEQSNKVNTDSPPQANPATYYHPCSCFNHHACMPQNFNNNFSNSCTHPQPPCCHYSYAYQPQCTNNNSTIQSNIAQNIKQQDESSNQIVKNEESEKNSTDTNVESTKSEQANIQNWPCYNYQRYPTTCCAHNSHIFLPKNVQDTNANVEGGEQADSDKTKIETTQAYPLQPCQSAYVPATCPCQIPLHCYAQTPCHAQYSNCCMHHNCNAQGNVSNIQTTPVPSPRTANSVSFATTQPQSQSEPIESTPLKENNYSINNIEMPSPRTPRRTPRQLPKITTSVSEILPPFNTNNVIRSPRMPPDDSNEDIIIRNSNRQLALQHQNQKQFHKQFQQEYAQGFYNKRSNGLDIDNNRRAMRNKLILNPAEPCNSSKINLVKIMSTSF